MNLRALRIRRRLTQDEAAKLIGVTRNALSACERGARHMDVREIAAYAKVYKVPMEAVCFAAVESLNKKGSKYSAKGTKEKSKQDLLELV